MRNILIQSAPVLVWFLAITETMISSFSGKRGSTVLSRLSSYVAAGLAFDAVVQATGIFLGEGTTLKVLSQMRFILHGVLVPLLVPIAFHTYGLKRKSAEKAVWILTTLLIASGVAMGFMTRTMPVRFAGILRYAQDPSTPAFARMVNTMLSFGGVLPLIAVGVAHLVKHRSPFLLLSGLFMFAFSAIAPATGNMDLNFLTTMIGEDIMVFFFAFELRREERNAR